MEGRRAALSSTHPGDQGGFCRAGAEEGDTRVPRGTRSWSLFLVGSCH